MKRITKPKLKKPEKSKKATTKKQTELKVKIQTLLSKQKLRKKLNAQVKEDMHTYGVALNYLIKTKKPNYVRITQLRKLHTYVVNIENKRLANIDDPKILEKYSKPYKVLAEKVKQAELKIIEDGKIVAEQKNQEKRQVKIDKILKHLEKRKERKKNK